MVENLPTMHCVNIQFNYINVWKVNSWSIILSTQSKLEFSFINHSLLFHNWIIKVNIYTICWVKILNFCSKSASLCHWLLSSPPGKTQCCQGQLYMGRIPKKMFENLIKNFSFECCTISGLHQQPIFVLPSNLKNWKFFLKQRIF